MSGPDRRPAPPPEPRRAGADGFVFDPVRNPESFDGVLWKRVFAYWVDVIVLAFVLAVLYVPAVVLGALSLGTLWPPIVFALALTPLFYHTVLIGGARSATLGMRLFGIEVRVRDGGRPNFVRAAVLTVLFYVSIVLTSMLVLVVALLNREKRTLHDIVCDTIVVNRTS